MKMFLLAILLIIGGLPNMFKPDTALTGIICVVLGVIIVFGKIFVNSKAEKESVRQSIQRTNTEQQARAREEFRRIEEYEKVENRWQAVMNEHYKLSDQIGIAYTVANNLSLPDSPEMQHVIELCKKDIAIAELFKKAHIEITQAQIKAGYVKENEVGWALPSYPSFKRLAIIYEKQMRYEDAINVCRQAIELGYINDGTEGQMPGRIARLIKKQGKTSKKIKKADVIVVEDTGAMDNTTNTAAE